MPLYRRRHHSMTWHWRRNCPDWPTSDYVSSLDKPKTGEFCGVCREKQYEEVESPPMAPADK